MPKQKQKTALRDEKIRQRLRDQLRGYYLSQNLNGGPPKVTLPKMSWDNEEAKNSGTSGGSITGNIAGNTRNR